MPVKFLTTDRKFDLAIVLYAFTLMFFLSFDSYIYDMWGRVDSAWFFMGGKAMMNGMTPYVDFTDSKGPLLWLIYGLGYLLSRDTYIGVFWISVAFVSVTFLFYDRTIRLFIRDRRQALVATFLMGFAYFLRFWRYETRAEDFCTTFIAIAFFLCLDCLKNSRGEARGVRRASFWLGICFGACLLIKFTVAAMVGVMMLCIFIRACRQKQGLPSAGMMVAGAAAICTPFVVYLACMNAFVPFLQEYFITTSGTIHTSGMLSGMAGDFGRIFTDPRRWPCLLYMAAAFIFSRRHRNECGWFPFIATAGFVLLSSLNAYWPYYLTASVSCALFLVIPLVEFAAKEWPWKPASTMQYAVTCLLITVLCTGANIFPKALFFNQDGYSPHYSAEMLFKQVEKPKLLNLGFETGIGLQADALPAGKYWAWQAGSSEAMTGSMLSLASGRKADFIFIGPGHENLIPFVEENGYKFCIDVPHKDSVYKLYCRNELDNTVQPVYVSKADILLKRNILEK